jgi:hypothetical protein
MTAATKSPPRGVSHAWFTSQGEKVTTTSSLGGAPLPVMTTVVPSGPDSGSIVTRSSKSCAPAGFASSRGTIIALSTNVDRIARVNGVSFPSSQCGSSCRTLFLSSRGLASKPGTTVDVGTQTLFHHVAALASHEDRGGGAKARLHLSHGAGLHRVEELAVAAWSLEKGLLFRTIVQGADVHAGGV